MIQSFVRSLAVVLVLALAAPLGATLQNFSAAPNGHTISGRVVDPYQLHPEDLTLMVGRRDKDQNSFGVWPVRFKADGSFVTERLDPDTYVLELVRTPNSPSKPQTSVGLTLVPLRNSDVSNVIIEVRRDTALTGTFKMESDNPNAVWPPEIVVNANLAVDGMTFLGSTVAEGASGGKFVLRNTFGPRVLRCGYTLGPNSRWWPSRVMLDDVDVDITNVPTDFSLHQGGHLEMVFTQHPARLRGTVTDASGQPVRAPWILLAPAEPQLREHWSSMLHATQGNTRGEFSIAVAPGEYRVGAVPQKALDSYTTARRNILQMTSDATVVDIKPRESKDVSLRLSAFSP